MKLFFIIICFLSFPLFSQELDTIPQVKNWTIGGMQTVNFGQVGFKNWSIGGENSIMMSDLTNLFANYKKGKCTFENSISLAYSTNRTGKAFKKLDDRINVTTKLGRKFYTRYWFFSILLNFKSQFTNGYIYPDDSTVVSHFLAPAYIINAYGIDYRTENNSLTIFLSPLTFKSTIVNDQRMANKGFYGVRPAKYDTVNEVYGITEYGEKYRNQLGGYLKINYQKDFLKKFNYSTKIEIFSHYLKDPQNLVFNWENLITFNATKYLIITLNTFMVYDQNIPITVEKEVNGEIISTTGPRLQFSELFTMGLAYKIE